MVEIDYLESVGFVIDKRVNTIHCTIKNDDMGYTTISYMDGYFCLGSSVYTSFDHLVNVVSNNSIYQGYGIKIREDSYKLFKRKETINKIIKLC